MPSCDGGRVSGWTDGAVREVPGGIVLRIRLTPRGGRDAITGTAVLADGSAVIVARVAAAPVDGAANASLEKLISRALNVSRGSASIVSGQKDRLKVVEIRGDPAALLVAGRKAFQRKAR